MITVALAKYLRSRGLLAFDETGASGDCFIAHLPSSPDEAVMLKPYGGNPLIAGDSQGWDEPTIQVLVRGTSDPRSASLRAGRIYAATQGLRNLTLDAGGADEVYLVNCRAEQSAPIHIGSDESGRHLFSLNLALHVRAQTEHRE